MNSPETIKDHDEVQIDLLSCKKIRIPDYHTIFEIKFSEFSQTNKEDILVWTQWHAALSQIDDEQYKQFIRPTTIFIVTIFNYCKDLERFGTLIKWMLAFFEFDDHCEETFGDIHFDQPKSKIVYAQFMRMLDKLIDQEEIRIVDCKPYILVLYTIFEEICRKYDLIQKRRFVDKWKDYVQGNIMEADYFGRNNLKNFQDLLNIRTRSIGVWPTLVCIEYAAEIYLNQHDWHDERLQHLGDLAAINAIYVNDLFSFAKEYKQRKDRNKMFNFVAFISIHENCTIEVAMDKIVKLLKQNEDEMFKLHQEIVSDGLCSAEKKIFVNGILDFVSGNFQSHTCGRYSAE